MKLSKKQWICGGAALLSLTVCGILTAVSSHIAGLHEMQYAAERWQGSSDTEYSQLSAFFTEDTAMTEDGLQFVRESVDAAMLSASLDAASETARLWYDAYSSHVGTMDLSGTKRYSAQADVTAVGGDFFTLHNQQFLSGSALQESDLMQDRVVLDETLAWQLFGSADVAGMQVLIGDRYYPVAGVIVQEEDYATKQAYGELPRMYISFDLYTEWEAETASTPCIECYEMVIPNPVRNFAKNAFDSAVGAGTSVITLENTNRFSLTRSWGHLTKIHDLMVMSQRLAYPYWENAARIVDFDLALLLGARILFLIYPVIVGLWLLWKGYHIVNAFLMQKRADFKNRYRSLIPDEETQNT